MTRKPLGFVVFGGGNAVATLVSKDRWDVKVGGVAKPFMANALRSIYSDHYAGPQDGHYGELILKDLASRVNGKHWFEPPGRPGPGDTGGPGHPGGPGKGDGPKKGGRPESFARDLIDDFTELRAGSPYGEAAGVAMRTERSGVSETCQPL